MDYEKKYNEALERAKRLSDSKYQTMNAKRVVEEIFPVLAESEDERTLKGLQNFLWHIANGEMNDRGTMPSAKMCQEWLAYLEKQKENPKTADSIPSDCASDAKCEDRWHKVGDSLPDNGRLVLANDCLGNTLLARYDGEGNWEVSVYDNDDYYCRNTITKWCDIPSEKQKEQKPVQYEEEKEYIRTLKSRIADFLRGKDKDEVDTTYYQRICDWLEGRHVEQKPSEEQMEVDLEKEIEVASKRFPEVSFAKLSRIAKRFYELGLRAGQVYAATTYNPPCYCGGPCTNPMHDCINCPRQLSGRINTTTGTSSAKLEESK